MLSQRLNVYSYCSAPQCDVFLHCTKNKIVLLSGTMQNIIEKWKKYVLKCIILWYILFSIVVFLAFEIFVTSWKKLAFQNHNSRGCHFKTSCNNLSKFSVNVLCTCRKLFAFFQNLLFSWLSFPRKFLFKIVIKKPSWCHYRCHFEFKQHPNFFFFFKNLETQLYKLSDDI